MSTAKLALNVGIKMVQLLDDFNCGNVLFHEFLYDEFLIIWKKYYFSQLTQILS